MNEWLTMLTDAAQMFLFLAVELSVLFLVISAGVSLIRQKIPDEKIQRMLGARHGKGYLLSALLGAVTPFCSCSTIPMLRGLLSAKAGFGPTLTFLFISPLLNPIIVGLMWATFGWKVTLLYAVIAASVSNGGGAVLAAAEQDSGLPKTQEELDALIEQFPQSLTGTEGAPVKTETMRQLGNELLQILTDGLEEVPQQIQSPEPDMAYNLDGLNYESVQTDTAETQMQTEAAPETATETVQEHPEILSQQEGQAAAEEKGVAGQQEAETMETVSGKTTYTGQMSQTPHTLGAVLSQEQLQHLNRMIGDILGKPQSAYNANSGTVEVLKDLQQLCKDPLPLEREHLGKLFSSREFQALVRDTAEQQWMAKPGDLKEGDYVGRLYERLNSQMEKIESALKNAGQEHTAFSQMAGEIHSNVEFMNQVNQMYTYAQIPLKMSGQHASGELFVYTNKKALAQGEKDLTAFLHLDLIWLLADIVNGLMAVPNLIGLIGLRQVIIDETRAFFALRDADDQEPDAQPA